MKTTIKFFSTTLLLMLGSLAFGQSQTMDNVRVAIKSGNSSTLASYFSSSVDVKTVSDEGVYSSSQAALILQKFFSSHPADSFKYDHNGSTSSNSMVYSIGTYSSGSSSYRVFISYSEVGGKYLIDKIHFDLE